MNLLDLPRGFLRAWARSGIAPGICYAAIETFGHRLAGGSPLKTKLAGGAVVHCDVKDHVQRHIYFWGAYEAIEVFVVGRLLKSGMTFVDAGANVGQYSLLASKLVGSSGRVCAFEPIPDNFESLKRNIDSNRLANVMAVKAALWHEPARLKMGRDEHHRDNSGTFRVLEKLGTGFDAEALPFDQWAAKSGVDRVDFVKIDVEGAELMVLKGMAETLNRFHPYLLIEMQNESRAELGYSSAEIFDLLAGLGYRCWQISERPDERRWISRGEKWTAHNLLFHRGELPKDLMTPWNWKTAIRDLQRL